MPAMSQHARRVAVQLNRFPSSTDLLKQTQLGLARTQWSLQMQLPMHAAVGSSIKRMVNVLSGWAAPMWMQMPGAGPRPRPDTLSEWRIR